jgi:hypothetical protein
LNFEEELVNYHIVSSEKLLLNKPFAGNSEKSKLIIGDGFGETMVELLPASDLKMELIVNPLSTLIISNQQPGFTLNPQQQSHIIYKDCFKLKMPRTGFSNLSIINSRILQSDTLTINGDFSYNLLALTGVETPNLTTYLNGNLSIGVLSGTGQLKVIGTHTGDQKIFTYQHLMQNALNLSLFKSSSNFVLWDPLKIENNLKIGLYPD